MLSKHASHSPRTAFRPRGFGWDGLLKTFARAALYLVLCAVVKGENCLCHSGVPARDWRAELTCFANSLPCHTSCKGAFRDDLEGAVANAFGISKSSELFHCSSDLVKETTKPREHVEKLHASKMSTIKNSLAERKPGLWTSRSRIWRALIGAWIFAIMVALGVSLQHRIVQGLRDGKRIIRYRSLPRDLGVLFLIYTSVFLIFLSCLCGILAQPTTQYFTTVGLTSYVVPADVTLITATLNAGSGGNAACVSGETGYGGRGGRVQVNIPVTAGETLHLNVGGQGGIYETGFNGGGALCAVRSGYPSTGGGGASDIRRSPFTLHNRIVVAGGGGGIYCFCSTAGGAGGYPNGGAGGVGTCGQHYKSPSGGTQYAGGTVGSSNYCYSPGGFGVGGACCGGNGGGGGGGYWGGGSSNAAGGGGGSTFISGSAALISHTSGANTGAGSITLTFTPNPTRPPTRAPSLNPTKDPTLNPTPVPSFNPTFNPTSQPSALPTMQPSAQPSSYPSGQPSVCPTGQPSLVPSSMPTCQPTRQPSAVPSTQPSSHPTSQPSTQPTSVPSVQPSSDPSSQPSSQPTSDPTGQPSIQPSRSPTTQPSSLPSAQPSSCPTTQPSAQPSEQPSGEPSGQPSSQPTSEPTSQPSSQPTSDPTGQPSAQPSAQPTLQPSSEPTSQPSAQPSSEPTSQPSSQPSSEPSAQPSAIPSAQPSSIPSAQPSTQPSTQPSSVPSNQPSSQPSAQPSHQPTGEPSSQPTIQPTSDPSGQPSSQPTDDPSAQPTCQPSNQPTGQPSMQPTTVPTSQPSSQPSHLPTSQPCSQPSRQPSNQPSAQPSTQPSSQPSSQPSNRPSVQPTEQPSAQPLSGPTGQPSGAPTALPTLILSPREYVYYMPTNETIAWNSMTYIDGADWVCGTTHRASLCTVVDSPGILRMHYAFNWLRVDSVHYMGYEPSTIITGSWAAASSGSSTDIAKCTMSATELLCRTKSFLDTNFFASSFALSSKSFVYVGTNNIHASISMMDDEVTAVRTYQYSTDRVKNILMTHVQSPPNFIGTFIAGTCTGIGAVAYIFAGMIRPESGIVTAMYVTPTSGAIVSTVELVSAMAQENIQPDSFIAGGMQTVGAASPNAYLIRTNALYQRVIYGRSFQIDSSTVHLGRRALNEARTFSSVVKGLALVDTDLYVMVSWNATTDHRTLNRITILKTDMATGLIQQQVHITSPNSSLYCTNINSGGLFLTLTCTIKYLQKSEILVILSVDRQLTCSQLPSEFERHTESVFSARNFAFQRVSIPLSVRKVDSITTDYTFTTAAIKPTRKPTTRPTTAPSVQPSAHSTYSDSVSAQPTSSPSTSNPTNTYKPTMERTVRPSILPTKNPTVLPSPQPVVATARPTKQPSRKPSAYPSVKPKLAPTRAPQCKPSLRPTAPPQMISTLTPSLASTSVSISCGRVDSGLVLVIGGSIIGGLSFLWCIYQLIRWCTVAKIAPGIQKIGIDNSGDSFASSFEVVPIAARRATTKHSVVEPSNRDSYDGDDSVALSSLRSSEMSFHEEDEDEFSVYSDELSCVYSDVDYSNYSEERNFLDSRQSSMTDESFQSLPQSQSQSQSLQLTQSQLSHSQLSHSQLSHSQISRSQLTPSQLSQSLSQTSLSQSLAPSQTVSRHSRFSETSMDDDAEDSVSTMT